MAATGLTLDQLRDGPPTVDVPTACKLIGISRAHGYLLASRGEFPCRTLKAGGRVRVITASLLRLLADEAAA